MADRPVYFDEASARRLANSVRWEEASRSYPRRYPSQAVSTGGVFTARVTGEADENGLYPAVITWKTSNTEWEDAEAEILIETPNGETLSEDVTYAVRESRENGIFILLPGGGGSAGGVGIEHQDAVGAPFSYPSQINANLTGVSQVRIRTTLNSNDTLATGLYVAGDVEGSHIANIGIYPHGRYAPYPPGSWSLSKVTGGVVVKGNQTIHGMKRFSTAVQFGTGTGHSGNVVVVGGPRQTSYPMGASVSDQVDNTAYSWDADSWVTYGYVDYTTAVGAMIGSRSKTVYGGDGGFDFNSTWLELSPSGECYLQREFARTGPFFPVSLGPAVCWFSVRDASGTKQTGKTGTILPGAVATGGIVTNLGSGSVAIANGGTGVTSTPSNGQLLIGNGSGYTLAGLTPGTGISITSGSGSITVACTVTGVSYVSAPASSSSSGTAGQKSYDASWVYECVATDSWIRYARDSWPGGA